MSRWLFLVLGLVFGTLVSAVARAQVAADVYGFMTDERGITFQVQSNGCTIKKDFVLDVMEMPPIEVSEIRLIRRRTDPCKGWKERGARIFYSWKEVGLLPGVQFQITNPGAVQNVPQSLPPR